MLICTYLPFLYVIDCLILKPILKLIRKLGLYIRVRINAHSSRGLSAER